MSENPPSRLVAVVTGCTGFLGSELTKQLLCRGFFVRGTVRSLSSPRTDQLRAALDKEKVKFQLEQLTNQGAAIWGELELVEVKDLTLPAAVEELEVVLRGAHFLFHVASPFAIVVDDPQKQLIDTAVIGTRNVLEAAAKHKGTFRRAVVTSSVCAVHDCHQKQRPSRPDGRWCEEDWNVTSTLDLVDPPEGYWMSKTLGEKEAWAVAKAQGLSVATILPEFVMGPALTLSAAESSISAGFFKGFLEAQTPEQVPSGDWIFSDVRDVALAHILAATLPDAGGKRFIVASRASSINARDVTNILNGAASSPSSRLFNLAAAARDDWHHRGEGEGPEGFFSEGKVSPVKADNLDNTRAQAELGLTLTALDRTLTDMAESLVTLGFASLKRRS